MKRTLFLTAALISLASSAKAATYTDLTGSWCDETNNVIYNGRGYFAVESAANTSVDLTINLASLVSYVNSNDYKTGNYMLLWDDNAADYGLADNADTSIATGSRTPYLSGYWSAASWNADTNNISYSKLSDYAVDGFVTLNITNNSSSSIGVKVTATKDGVTETLYHASDLCSSSNTVTNGYYVNLNYVTAVTLNTASTLDTDSYVPPTDYSQPYVSQRSDGTTIGRVTFLGDSITHGVNDQSYRWQLFKTLTDNGIENEIVGPREGYFNTPGHTEDAGSSYGKAEFANVHLAQASGRTHNIISGSNSGMTGVNYGGHSTASTAEDFDSNTWFCMMGTNDMLSDGGASTTDYCNKMAKMLGGTVSYTEGTGYTWTADSTNWGTMGTIVDDVHGEGDTFYMLSITPWTRHANSNDESYHYGAQEFNRNLELWTDAYNKAHTGKNVVYVDVTRGMVDKTSDVSFYSPGVFFNNPGSDGLHPSDQGSIIMAGNLARAMGIGGRTAGLERSSATGWDSATVGTVHDGATLLVGENAFTMTDGYTVDLNTRFGNGAEDGWMSADQALSISLGDGTYSGTLNLSEGYIMWGSDILFCRDNSTIDQEGNLRIAWHNGNATDNVLQGYYVWLDDMLIGQGLSATEGEGLNGILLSAAGANGTVNTLAWSNKAYAPTTLGKVSAENAYLTIQDGAAITTLVSNTAFVTSGVDYSTATETAATAGSTLVTTTGSDTKNFKITSAAGWTGMTNSAHTGNINTQVNGETVNTIFGAMSGASGANLTLDVVEGAKIGNGSYNDKTAAIAGSYNGGSAESFNVYVSGGTVKGDIVGGAVHGAGTINTVKLVINGGTVEGQVMGGSKTDGTVNNATIIVKDGTIMGDINIGGNAGKVGQAHVAISGGYIAGHITKGNAEVAQVSVIGSEATISGSIEADKVSFTDAEYKLTLSNVTEVELAGRSRIEAIMGEQAELDALTLSRGSTFTAWKNSNGTQNVTEQEALLKLKTLNVGSGATLNANIELVAGASLALEGTLTMGSEVALASGLSLSLSDDLLAELYGGNEVNLFTGVDALFVDNKAIAAGTVVETTELFTGLSSEYTYYMSYDGNNVSLSIPEPTTATLSLLALAALAARRRRK